MSQKESSVTFAFVTKGTTGAHNKFPLPEVLQLLKSYDLTHWFRYAYFLHLCNFALFEEYCLCCVDVKLDTGSGAFSFLQ